MSGRITRRAAIKSMVAAPGLFTILPAGLACAYSANEKLNVALVGCGTRGRGLMEALGRIGEVRDVYVWQGANRGGPQTIPLDAEKAPSTLQWDL